LLLLAAAAVFQVRKPVARAVVSVQHVFKAPSQKPEAEPPLAAKVKTKQAAAAPRPVTEKKPPLSKKDKSAEKASKPPSERRPALKEKVLQSQRPVAPLNAKAKPLDAGPKKALHDQSKSHTPEVMPRSREDSSPPMKKSKHSETRLAISHLQKTLPAAAKQKAGQVPANPKTLSKTAGSQAGFQQADPEKRSVTVSSENYRRLFNDWQMAGKGLQGKPEIRLRVENLRDTFELFQMKPVVVVNGQPFADLASGSRIAQGALEDYGQTVFLISDPWEKWSAELKNAGLKTTDNIEIRYYMYDFVRRAIYARAHQALAWSREEGLILKDTPSDHVKVLGRAFVIRQQGGGRFGVLIPIKIEDRNGTSVAVDPSCFGDQSDVQLLQRAGLIRG
jgi:hypothetical protein